jgi:hypothetical protein
MSTSWNSLEITKLIFSLLTPLVLAVVGVAINDSVKTAERSAGLRSKIYEEVGGDLNDIYSYVAFVGGWKELAPVDIIAKKRAVDKNMYTYRPFFSKELFATYERFMDEAFRSYGGAGTDAQIRSDIETADGDRRQHTNKGWDLSWENRFTKERNKLAQRVAYDEFLEQLARDLKL